MKKILIAEDEKPIRNALQNKLQSEGFEVVIAANGQEALEKIEKEKIDFLLLDLMMPVVDGFGVLSELKQRKIDCPVFVLSNLSQENDVKKALELGAKDFIVKANTPIMEIINKVKKALE